jgi:DNA segregation ATPase FtsK/SpoIIIE-like protein
MTKNIDAVPLAWNLNLLQAGIRKYVYVDFDTWPMVLVVGGTGAGKSYFLALFMAKIASHIQDSQLFLCDFKDIDYRMFADCPRRSSYENCFEGLSAFYDSFLSRLNGEDTSTNRKILVFDEWAAFVMSRDKKTMEEVKTRLSTLLMMGRGVKHHIIIGLQRGDSALFPLGGRDNFSAILAMGNISKEQKLMLFADERGDMTDINVRGQGYLSLDGKPILRVQVPTVTDFTKLHIAIRDGLSR